MLQELLNKARSVEEKAKESAKNVEVRKEEEVVSSFMCVLDDVWQDRIQPTVQASGRGADVVWVSRKAIKSGSTLCRAANSYNKTGGLEVKRVGEGSSITLTLPGRDNTYGRSENDTLSGNLSALVDIRESMYPQSLRKLLPKVAPEHPLFTEAFIALDAYYVAAGKLLLLSIQGELETLVQRKKDLEERLENIVPPMEKLAAVPTERTRKKA